MIKVIEHLMNLVKAVEKYYDALKNGGLLVVQTGNIESISAGLLGKKWFYFLLGHLNYFSPRTLHSVLENKKFKIEKIYF